MRCALCGLTFELSGAQRHGPWAARTMINKPAARPRGHAVARPLERGVRPHRLAPTTSTERDDAADLAQLAARADPYRLRLLGGRQTARAALPLESMEDTASEAPQPETLPARASATTCAEVPGHCASKTTFSAPERTNINWAPCAHAALCAACCKLFRSALTPQAFRDSHLVFSHLC